MMAYDPLQQVEIISGGDDADTITKRCLDIAHSTSKFKLTNSFELYERLLLLLKEYGRFEIVPIKDIVTPALENKIKVALRHDIDADIVTAVSCARKLAEVNLPGSFYVLHTSHYYGVVPAIDTTPSVLVRHKGLRYFLSELNETGNDIGIHNDVLGLIINHGIDGYRVLCEEIDWLRGNGVNITSSVAHNSATVYGAECFEIFEGMAAGNRKSASQNGKSIALQRLDAQALGLEYEANFPRPRPVVNNVAIENLGNVEGNALHTPSWLLQYFINHPIFERRYDYDIWLVGEDLWLLAGANEVQFPLTFDQLSILMKKLPLTSRVVISIHPIYVSKKQ